MTEDRHEGCLFRATDVRWGWLKCSGIRERTRCGTDRPRRRTGCSQLPGKSPECSPRSAPPASSRRPLAMIWAVAWFAAKGVFQCAECKSLTEAQRHRARSQSLKADRSIPVPAASRAADGRDRRPMRPSTNQSPNAIDYVKTNGGDRFGWPHWSGSARRTYQRRTGCVSSRVRALSVRSDRLHRPAHAGRSP